METAGIFLLPNGTFIVELAVFLVILFVIAKYILPPLNKAMEKRQEEIRGSLAAAEEAKADAEAADEERRATLEEARGQAREIVANANATAERLRAEAEERGQREYERVVSSAQADIALARQRAVDEVSAGIGALVVSVARQVIGREIDADSHRDLIEEAVTALRGTAESSAPQA